jgi:hypothetical protein
VGRSETEKEESSFLKKRSKRLLRLRRSRDPGHGLHRDAGAGIKVFCCSQGGRRLSSEKQGFFHFGAALR